MKNLIRSTVAILSIGLGLGPALRAERSATQPSSGPWTQTRPEESSESGPRQIVSGRVLSTKDLKAVPGQERGVEMTLNTPEGDLRVHIGPRWFSTSHSINLTHGEPVTVVGMRFTWEGKPAIAAEEIRQGEKKVILREPAKENTDSAPVECRTEDEALAILTRDCAACHLAADHPGALFLNRARLSEPGTIRLLIDLIETRQMPPAHRKFKESPDGKALLQWLKGRQKPK